VLPSSSCILQSRLGLPTATKCFDLNLGCSGFIYAISIAASMIETALSSRVLIVCADTYNRYIDLHDRTTRPIFSDGAAAVLMSRSDIPCMGPFLFGTDGSQYDSLIVREGGARSRNPQAVQRLEMQGSKVFAFTMSTVVDNVRQLIEIATPKRTPDLFVFHQASKLVLDNLQRKLSIPNERLYRNLEFVGNTVSATIPIALKHAASDGTLRGGQLVLLSGFGVGLSWGSCLLNWSWPP
jgi:3-oxoacyl-[acyl-carrier-protein] synthase III